MAAPERLKQGRGSSPYLPAPWQNPWGLLWRDLGALLASLRLGLRELWRRNGEGSLWRPAFWPKGGAKLFWPFMVVALVVLLQADPRILLALPVMVIIGREITVSALREWMAEVGARAAVAVSMLGKIKTTAQMISIALLILRDSVFGPWLYPLGVVLVYIAAMLTLWSMAVYLVAAWPSLSGKAVTGSGEQC